MDSSLPARASPRRVRVIAASLAVGSLLLAQGALAPRWVSAAGGAADAQASELRTDINDARASRGLPRLAPDSFLSAKARDGSIACPNDSTRVMYGRAHDFALYPAWFTHSLRLCPTKSVLDVMPGWGYWGALGEIIASNTYPSGQTAAVALSSFLGSSSHAAIVLGDYARFGCGAWRSGNGTYYYSCLFAQGGAGRIAPRPTPRPTARPTVRSPGQPTARPTARSAAPSAALKSNAPASSTPSSQILGVTADPGRTPSPSTPAVAEASPSRDAVVLPSAGTSGGPDPGLLAALVAGALLTAAGGAAGLRRFGLARRP